MSLPSILILGCLAALNLTARANDAVRIVAPEPGERRTKLLDSTRWLALIVGSVSTVIVFVIAASRQENSDPLMVAAFAMMLAAVLAVLVCVRGATAKSDDLQVLFSDRIARNLGGRAGLDGDKAVILARLALAMLKVAAFLLAVTALIH